MTEVQGQTRDVTFQLAVRDSSDNREAFKRFQQEYQSLYEGIDHTAQASAERRAKGELSAFRGIHEIMAQEAERRLDATAKKFDALVGKMSGAKSTGEESPFTLRKPATEAIKGVADNAKRAVEHFREADKIIGTMFIGVDRIGKSTASWLKDVQSLRGEFKAIDELQRKLGTMPTVPAGVPTGPRGKPKDSDDIRRERASQAGLSPLMAGHDSFMGMSDTEQKRVLENQQRLRARIADESRKAREREAADEQRHLMERERRWERTEDQIFRTRQSSTDRMRSLDHELGQSLLTVSGGAAHLVRSFALLGLAGEENSRKLVDGLMKAQAAFDLIKGGAQTFLAIKRAFDLFNLSQRESAKLKEADARSAELAKEKSLAMTAALTTEAAAAERAARSHEHLARSRSRSGGAGGAGGAAGIVAGMMGGGFGRGRRGRIGRGAALGSLLELGGSALADDSDSGGMSDALIASGMGVDLLSMLRPGYLSRGLQSAGRGLSMAGRVAGPVAWGAAAVGAGANVLDVAQGRDPQQAGRNQWLGETLLGGSLAISRATGWTGSGASIADIGGTGERFTDTTRKILAFEQNRNLMEFSAGAEARQQAERAKTIDQQRQEIREREQARRDQLESERQVRERAAEERLALFRPIRERRDSLLDVQAGFSADRLVDSTMGRRRASDRQMDNQVADLTKAIRALESSGSSGFALRGLEMKLSELSSQRRDQRAGQLSEGLTRDFAQTNASARVAGFQQREAQVDVSRLRSLRAGGDESVTDAQIREAEQRSIAAADKLASLARTRYDLERRAAQERRQSQQEAIDGLRQEIEMREQSMQRARESLMSARERFGDLSADEQKQATDLAKKLKAERESVLRTGQSSTEREEADSKLRQFQATGTKLTTAKEELERLEHVRDVRQSSPDKIKALRQRVDELSQDPNRSAELESAKKDLAAARAEQDRAQSSTAGTSRMHELREFIDRNRGDKSAAGEVQAAREELASTAKSEKSRRAELADLKRQRSRTRDHGERERLDAQIRQLSPDSIGLDEKLTTARRQVAALSQQHESQRQEADTIFQRRGAAQLQTDQDRTFLAHYEDRQSKGLPTTPAMDARREQIEERVRTQVASSLSQGERTILRSVGTAYEGDLAERSAQEQARRAGFDSAFGVGSGTSQEARQFRDSARQRQDLNVKLNLENANWELKPQVDADELARMAANAVRPMMDQMRAAMERAMTEAFAQQAASQQSQTRSFRAGETAGN